MRKRPFHRNRHLIAPVLIAFGLGLVLTMIGAFRLALFLAAIVLICAGISLRS